MKAKSLYHLKIMYHHKIRCITFMYHLCPIMYHLLYHLFGFWGLLRAHVGYLEQFSTAKVELTISLIVHILLVYLLIINFTKMLIINKKSGLYFRKIHLYFLFLSCDSQFFFRDSAGTRKCRYNVGNFLIFCFTS